MPVPTMNSIVSALRFFFTHTLDRPDLARRLVRLRLSAQAAGGAEPRRGRPAARRHHLPQASGRAVGRLWRRPARGRGLGAQGQRHRQRAHADPGRARQGRPVPQRHAPGGSAHPAARVVEGRTAAGRDAARRLAVSRPACAEADQHPAAPPHRRRGGTRPPTSPSASARTRCGTASPPTCWRTASISA